MTGSTAGGIGVRGLGTTARVTTAPAGIAVTGPTTGSVRVRGLRTTGMTATSIRMRCRRIHIRMRSSRPITSMAGPTGAITRMTSPVGVGVTGAGVAVAGSTVGGVGVRGLGTTGMTATGIRM